MADDPQYNANCPYCGEETLIATVQALNSNVPLKPADYDFDEGIPEGTEIIEITCFSCSRGDITSDHYFNHGPEGDPCDCDEPIDVDIPEVIPDQSADLHRRRQEERNKEEDQNDGE